MDCKLKIYRNSKNKQYLILLSKKQFAAQFKNKNPKFLHIKEGEFLE